MKKKEGSKTIILYKWIWQSYMKAALIPLVLVELVFVGIYFMTNNWSQREIINHLSEESSKELIQIAMQKADVIQQQVTSISNAAEMYSMQIGRALSSEASISTEDVKRLTYSPEGVYYTKEDSKSGGAAIFYSGNVPVGDAEQRKVGKVLTTQNLMKDIIKSQPLAASIYLNTFDSLNIIYPYFDVITQYAPLTDIPTYNFYYEADMKHNPERKVKWTDAYLDPAGHGWMASAISPVYNGDFLEGVVGIDVTVSTISKQILSMEIPWDGYSILLGKDGTILALPSKGEKDWGLTELTEHHYEEAILKDTFKPDAFNLYKRETLVSFATQVTDKSTGFSTIMLNNNPQAVSWSTVSDTGWKLLVIAPEKNIYAKVNETKEKLFKIGTFMIAGLIFFYCIFFYVLAKIARKMSLNVSSPLLEINGIVQRIGEGNYYQQEPDMYVKELKDTAVYLVNMGNQLGEANSKLLQTQSELKKRERDLQALVNSIDDLILHLDENGTLIDIWASKEKNMAKALAEGRGNTLETVFDKNTAQLAKDQIKKVIKTNEPDTLEYQLETVGGIRWFQARVALVDNETRTVVVTARDITERKEMEASMIAAKEEAEKASKAKSEFLSSMSHELRTPLNAILGFSQVLEMDPEAPLTESQDQCVKEILKAGSHLLELINEVLDLAKIESGKMTLSIEPVQVKPIMEETYSLIKPFADKNGIQVVYEDLSDEDYFVLADRTRIKQVLINLLSNAVKYNKKKGKVNFYYEKLQSSIRFNVIDTGCGILEMDLEEVFKPFQRLHMTNSQVEGTGIGLTVAKQLMELMSGNIHVESKIGVGSHFWIELPYTETSYSQEVLQAISTDRNEYSENNEMNKILYVEDNPANLKLIERIITKLPNTKMFSAPSGELSIDLARAHKPDIILLDINLPGIDGYEVFRRLQRYVETRDIPVIAVSANAMEKDIEKGMAFGFKDYITKPINVAKVLEKISNVLEEK
jgi:PAS domain S-box-containing protein